MSDLGPRFAKLVELAKAPTSEKRRDLLREVTDLFFDTADVRTSRETHLFDDVLRTVARDMQQDVLGELAERFADAHDAPAQLIHDLAAHDFAVAEPVLRRSPVLGEDALVNLVGAQSQNHIKAIAQRDSVGPRLSGAIVSAGDDNAIEALLDNAGATIDRPAMERVVDRARDSARLHRGVVGRNDIPLDLLNEMYFVVEKKLRAAIMERNAAVDPAELDHALVRARARVQARTDAALDEDLKNAIRLVEQKKRAGELKPALLVAFYRDGNIAAFTFGLAEIVGLDYDATHAILSRRDIEALAMICRASNIERPLFVTIALLCAGGDDAMGHAESFGRLYAAVPVEAAQRAMRFYRVRKNASAATLNA